MSGCRVIREVRTHSILKPVPGACSWIGRLFGTHMFDLVLLHPVNDDIRPVLLDARNEAVYAVLAQLDALVVLL